MNTDIRIYISLLNHRKLRRLAKSLGESNATAVGHLVCLWARVASDSPNGLLKDWDNQDIAEAADWDGEPNDFVEAMTNDKALWLDRSDEHECYVIHDWEEHQPWACKAKERSIHAQKAARVRWGQVEGQESIEQCSEHSAELAHGNAPSLSSPFLDKPDLSLPSPSPVKENNSDNCVEESIIHSVLGLPNWNSSNIDEDITWITDFVQDFPDFNEQHLKGCRDHHSRKKNPDQAFWKTRLRNWMETENNYKRRKNGKSITDAKKTVPGEIAKFAKYS